LRSDFNEKIQEMSESKGVDSLITQELQRSKEELEEAMEKLRNVTKNEEKLSLEIQARSQQLEIADKALSKQKQQIRDLSQDLETARNLQQKAELSLQIRKETSSEDDHQEALISTRQDNEQLRQDKISLQKELKTAQEDLQSIYDSKIRLAQSVAAELDRMRSMFVELTVATAKARSATVG